MEQKAAQRNGEFGFGKKNWKPYDPAQNKKLSQAFASDEKTVDRSTPKAEYTIIFDRMVQRSKKTGWEVPVRCKLSDPAADKKCTSSSGSTHVQYIFLYNSHRNSGKLTLPSQFTWLSLISCSL